MKLITFLKFGAFVFVLAFIPLILALLFFQLHEAHTSTYLGFFAGLVLDAMLFIFVLEPLFESSIKYVHKKEKERELIRQGNNF